MSQVENTCTPQTPWEPTQFESALTERHDELARITAELRSLHENFCERTRTELGVLVEENESLRQLLAEKERSDDTVVDARLPEVIEDVENLTAENQKLSAENQRLQRRLQEKEELLAELRQETETPREGVDLESYETELNRFRQQLEADRQKLNAELQHIRVRNEELDEATREMEMEFSRERAELARERTKLERLREEVRAELERVQRDTPMRESMMSVHRLRESLTQPR